MKSLYKAVVLAGSLVCGVSAMASPVNIDGVVFNAGAQFLSTTLWETQLTSSSQSFDGVGIVNQIANPGNAGITWNNGDNTTQLTYYFSGYTVSSWQDTLGNWHAAGDDTGSGYSFASGALQIVFTGGSIKVYADDTVTGTKLDPSAGSSNYASDISKATDGKLWLNYAGVDTFNAINGKVGTLFAQVTSGTNVNAGGVGTGYLNVSNVGGVGDANSNFDTNAYNVFDGSGLVNADAFLNSSYSTLNAVNGFALGGSGNINTNAIPEPTSVALVGLGLLGLGLGRRAKKS